MGNSVADWATPGYRDRYKVNINNIQLSGYYAKDKAPLPKTYLGSGSASRISDQSHLLWRNPLYWKLRDKPNGESLREIDVGGPFALERVTVGSPVIIDRTFPSDPKFGTTYRHIGYFPPSVGYQLDMANIASGRFPAIPPGLGIDRFQLWSLGPTAVSRSLPDVPAFSLFRFIGELREGLPKVPLKALAKERKFRNTGGEYLNFQFGIAPTVSDLQKFTTLLMNPALRASIKHMLEDEHRVRKVIDKGTVSTTRSLTSTELAVPSSPYQTDVKGTETRVTSYRIWSSISFAYHQAALLDQLIAELDERLGGFGIIPKPIDVWNLIPWTWLVDWFTNFNHVITNLSYLGRDGLRIRRGYLMGTYSDVLTTRRTATYMGQPLESIGVRSYERKYRVHASPFGFGLTWKDFDPFQLSILGALGVSRMRF
jgi:hypothetical protein